MASMFGGFGELGQIVQGSPTPLSLGPSGGFPGIFPTAGVSNSGWAGFGTYGPVGPCTPEDVKSGVCVMGPPLQFLGKR